MPSSYSISYHLSSPCSRNDPPSLPNAAAVFHPSTLPHSDITAWTDGSVPGRLGEGGAGIHIKCTKYLTTTSLSFSARRWATSYGRAFEPVTLFSDFQSVLTTLYAPLPYLIPKSFTDTQSFLNSLFDSKVVHIQWIPAYSSLPGNDLANSLAEVGFTHDPSIIPLSLSPLISSRRLSLYNSWRGGNQSGFFQYQIPTVSSEEFTLPRSTRCALSFTLLRT